MEEEVTPPVCDVHSVSSARPVTVGLAVVPIFTLFFIGVRTSLFWVFTTWAFYLGLYVAHR